MKKRFAILLAAVMLLSACGGTASGGRSSSSSVNGYMTNFICYSRTIAPGGSGVLDVELMGSSLEGNGISGLEDIAEVELTVEVKNDSYKTVAKPVVTVKET